jgi:hypothetical protein
VLTVLHGAASAQNFCSAVTPESTTAATLLGNGTPGSLSTAQIQAALDAGGVYRFNVGAAPSTIVLSSTLNATRAVVLDGAGVVTLSGGGVRRILTINNPNPAQNAPHFTVALQHIAFAAAIAARDGGVTGALVPAFDQRGYPRVGTPDRGAFEYGAEGLLYADGFE